MSKTIGPTPKFAASLEHLAHVWYVASLGLFNRYYFVICPFDLAEIVPLHHSRGWSIRYSNRLNDFSVTIPPCSTSTVSLLAQLNSGIIYPQKVFLRVLSNQPSCMLFICLLPLLVIPFLEVAVQPEVNHNYNFKFFNC